METKVTENAAVSTTIDSTPKANTNIKDNPLYGKTKRELVDIITRKDAQEKHNRSVIKDNERKLNDYSARLTHSQQALSQVNHELSQAKSRIAHLEAVKERLRHHLHAKSVWAYTTTAISVILLIALIF